MNLSPALVARGLKQIAILGARREHGDRLRYMSGCRCADCRKANSTYECARVKARRNGDWNGIVSARNARAHILKLSRQGVGRRSVAIASDVSCGAIAAIRSGTKKRVRARTARRILAVTSGAASDRAFVPAGRTWQLIELLLEEGYTKADLARFLGYDRPALQFNRERVTARSAYQVECLYREITR